MFETPGKPGRWLLYADPQLAPLRRSAAGSITPITDWLHCADQNLAPLRRSRIGSFEPIIDTGKGTRESLSDADAKTFAFALRFFVAMRTPGSQTPACLD
jgi:hypothetical protein